jgi:hypothetical protein
MNMASEPESSEQWSSIGWSSNARAFMFVGWRTSRSIQNACGKFS